MILQRDEPVLIWGTADAGEKITVTINDQIQTTVADKTGKWNATLKALKAGGPYQLLVSGEKGKIIKIQNIKVGDVWICAGQSNMNFMLAADVNGATEIAELDNDNIREFRTNMPANVFNPENRDHSQWVPAKGKKAGTFSVVAYYFAKRLQAKENIPVGIIVMACGNTRAEAWTDIGFLKSYTALKPLLTYWENKKGDTTTTINHIPGKFYTDVVAPVVPFAVKGVLWYQGESNTLPDASGRTIAGRAAEYKTILQALIANWRSAWQNPTLPFGIVQLPNYKDSSADLHWAVLRQAQLETAKEVPHVGLAVTIDLGNAQNIHPTDKGPVSERLALWAFEKVYHHNTGVASGPIIKNIKIMGSKAVLRFDYTGKGLTSNGNQPLWGFEIADVVNPGVFVPATAIIKDEKIIVSADGIKRPVAVRYAWADDPDISLYNKDGLPASPFCIKKK